MDSSLAFIPSLETSLKFLSMLSGKTPKVDTLKLLSLLVRKNAYGTQRKSHPFPNDKCSCLSYNHSSESKWELSVQVYSGTLFPHNKMRHFLEAHHKYSTTDTGGRVSWSFSNLSVVFSHSLRRTDSKPVLNKGFLPSFPFSVLADLGLEWYQSACITDSIYISLHFLAKSEKSLNCLVTFKIFSAYSQNINARNDVQLQGI